MNLSRMVLGLWVSGFAACVGQAFAGGTDSPRDIPAVVSQARLDGAILGRTKETVQSGKYGAEDHQAASDALFRLVEGVSTLQAANPSVPDLPELKKALSQTLAAEGTFWEGLSPECRAKTAAVPKEPAGVLLASLDAALSQFDKVLPVAQASQGQVLGGDPTIPGSQVRLSQADNNVNGMGLGQVNDRPEDFFDRNRQRGQVREVVIGGAPGDNGNSQGPRQGADMPSFVMPQGFYTDRSISVPSFVVQDTVRSQPSASFNLANLSPPVSAAVDLAVVTVLPPPVRNRVVAQEKPKVVPSPGRPLPRNVPVVATPIPAPPSPCEEVLNEHPKLAAMCKDNPTIAPLLAGLLEAFKEQFGTIEGVVLNLLFMLLGLVLSALSGFGIIAKVLVSLVSIGMLIYTIGPLLKQGWNAFSDLMSSADGSREKFTALKDLGKVGGAVLIMGLMAAIGWGIGKTKPGAAAIGRMQGAATSAMKSSGVGAAAGGLDAAFPNAARFLGRIFGTPKPAAGETGSGTHEQGRGGTAKEKARPEPVPEEAGGPKPRARMSMKEWVNDLRDIPQDLKTSDKPWVELARKTLSEEKLLKLQEELKRQSDPSVASAAKAKFSARFREIYAEYGEIMAGRKEPPPGVSRVRLKLAVEGVKVDMPSLGLKAGDRVPLNFSTLEQFRQFKTELRSTLSRGGISDAVVQQRGSATCGFKTNPDKPLGPWTKASDIDYAVYSDQALAQARSLGAENPNPKAIYDGKFVMLKNGVEGGKGFYDTPVGAALRDLASRWNERIYGTKDPPGGGIDFKLNIVERHFDDGITMVQPGR